MTVDREWLLADAMRLEDVQPDESKGLWLVGRTLHAPFAEQVALVEALTAPGARAILETLELVRPDDDLTFAGPVDRRAFEGLEFLKWHDGVTVEAWMRRRDA